MSAGIVAPLGESYAPSQLPSRLPRSISRSPAAFICPSSMSRIAFSRLIFDQMLFSDLGVKRCSQYLSSSPFFWPSIHPKQRAASTACRYETDFTFAPFLAIRSHTPDDLAWFLSSQETHVC